jgi:hypothetical protein
MTRIERSDPDPTYASRVRNFSKIPSALGAGIATGVIYNMIQDVGAFDKRPTLQSTGINAGFSAASSVISILASELSRHRRQRAKKSDKGKSRADTASTHEDTGPLEEHKKYADDELIPSWEEFGR